MPIVLRVVVAIGCLGAAAVAASDNTKSNNTVVPLFTENGLPRGWSIREWNDLATPVMSDQTWSVADGVLRSGSRRGTWLVSDREYGNFILEFEIRLSEQGNSGVALRAPMRGDPAFDGMEMQVADFRYNTGARPSELTGGIYRAIAPTKQVYKPTEWNTCRIELDGDHLQVTLNGEKVQDVDLSQFDATVKRHDGTDAAPIKDRPRRGHIGFQYLSRDHAPVLIRNVRLKELP